MFDDAFTSIWFFLPAGAATAAAIFAARLPGLRQFSQPLDFGRTLQGRPVLGSHKTWRGLAAGVVLAAFVVWLERLSVHNTPALRDLIDPEALQPPLLVLGPLLGIGALGGDAVKSFFKRRRGTPPGHSWVPFDQIDYIVGAGLVSVPVVRLPLAVYLWALVLWTIIHFVSSYIGYLVGLKDQPV